MIPSRPAALLFDLDGTLVDSSPAHGFAYHRAFADYGLEVAPETFSSFEGLPHLVVTERLRAGRELPVTDADLHRRKTMYFAQELHRLRPLPLLQVVEIFRGELPLGLVTSATRETAERALDAFLDMGVFDISIAAGEAPAAKPDPAPYLLACARLGVEPSRTVVFEDSPSGVQSATSAGCQVIALQPPTSPER